MWLCLCMSYAIQPKGGCVLFYGHYEREVFVLKKVRNVVDDEIGKINSWPLMTLGKPFMLVTMSPNIEGCLC